MFFQQICHQKPISGRLGSGTSPSWDGRKLTPGGKSRAPRVHRPEKTHSQNSVEMAKSQGKICRKLDLLGCSNCRSAWLLFAFPNMTDRAIIAINDAGFHLCQPCWPILDTLQKYLQHTRLIESARKPWKITELPKVWQHGQQKWEVVVDDSQKFFPKKKSSEIAMFLGKSAF